MKKRAWAAMLALLLLAALIPTSYAATAVYTLRIDGGQTAEHLEVIDGVPCLKVDVYFDGITDSLLLSSATLGLTYNAAQLIYVTDSQTRGTSSIYAVNASGATVGARTAVVHNKDNQVRIAFASDYGCRIRSGMPFLSLYFRFAEPLAANTSIRLSLKGDSFAESTVMSEQTSGTDVKTVKRAIGTDIGAFRVTAMNGTAAPHPNDVQYKGSTPYVLYTGRAQTPRVIVKDGSGALIDAKYYQVAYSDHIEPGTAHVTVTFTNGYGGSIETWFKIYLDATSETRVENAKDGIRVSWAAVSGAKGYVIYRRAWNASSDGWTAFERWNHTTETFWTDPNGNSASGKPGGVYAGTRYQYGVKAYATDPMDAYNLGLVGPLKTTVRITTRTLNSVTAGVQRMTVKWTGSRVFTGYQIQYATNSTFTENAAALKIADPKTYETVITGLTSGKTYWVRLRSYHVFNGMTYFGAWSNVLSCKVN